MNDPHVVALVYKVEHPSHVTYDEAAPFDLGTDKFKIRIEDKKARFELKKHFPNVQAARELIESFIRKWEFSADLEGEPQDFRLRFNNAEVIDRAPTPGAMRPQSVSISAIGEQAFLIVGKGRYPTPLSGIKVSIEVEAMISRFNRYRQDRETLGAMAYYCLTELEHKFGGRTEVARSLGIHKKVLKKVGELCANKGGKLARKAEGRSQEFTPAEIKWLRATTKEMILRAAQVAHDPSKNSPEITMADLPNLSG